jgi:hypothetical protein
MLAIVTTSDGMGSSASAARASGSGGGGPQRYNRRRPNYKITGRVNYDDYPDPTSYGWTFTGSCEGGRAEFF